MRRLFGFAIGSLALAAGAALLAPAARAQVACLPGSDVFCLDQGSKWNNTTRKAFYSKDQGSQLMPLSWFKALKTPDNQPFLYDKLARYGYLPDPFRADLPIGFTTSFALKPMVGMTCAACHTRQIERDGFKFRVDGGPAMSDFRAFLSDMLDAVNTVRTDDTAFTAFAKAVLGAGASQSAKTKLKADIELWYLRENTLRERAYPTADIWGLGRLDAVAMIFNRLTGLDLGPPPSYLIPDNIQPADAPVRYPFLWNAAIQDKTQWPGFAGNGTSLTAMARNTGEVFGVFATFHPISPSVWIGNVNFRDQNSANVLGLLAVENLIKKIGPPKWPAQFPIIQGLVARGEEVYRQTCAGCHALNPVPAGTPGFPNIPTWKTPIQDVGTDSREYDILARKADPGVLINLKTSFIPTFQITNPSRSFDILKYSVIGSMVQNGGALLSLGEDVFGKSGVTTEKAKQLLEAAIDDGSCPQDKFCYESRVMFGIWAAAPYLHNGSVPTLWDLLQPSDQRPVTFAIGPGYDPFKIGIAAQQAGSYSRTTTGCEDRNSGNSRCGHEFGTTLPIDDKRALIEFMKTL